MMTIPRWQRGNIDADPDDGGGDDDVDVTGAEAVRSRSSSSSGGIRPGSISMLCSPKALTIAPNMSSTEVVRGRRIILDLAQFLLGGCRRRCVSRHVHPCLPEAISRRPNTRSTHLPLLHRHDGVEVADRGAVPAASRCRGHRTRVIATVRGIGVAVITRKCGCTPSLPRPRSTSRLFHTEPVFVRRPPPCRGRRSSPSPRGERGCR